MFHEKHISRQQEIHKSAVIGLLTNLILACFKMLVGFLSNSIAILTDGINSISEAFESIIILVGMKLSVKEADRKHPFGYGRMEYLMDFFVSGIILYAGISSLKNGISLLQEPVSTSPDDFTYLVLITASVIKLFLGRHEAHVAKHTDSNAVKAASVNSLASSIVSLSVLASLVLESSLHINLEAYVTIIISILILHTGYESLRSTMTATLGERLDGMHAKAIKETICSFDSVLGAYDLIVHAYGFGRLIGSVHIEVPSTMSVLALDRLEREIVQEVNLVHHVYLAGISIYAVDLEHEVSMKLKEDVQEVLNRHDDILQMHGFFVDEESKSIFFDMVVSFDVKDRHALKDAVIDELEQMHSDYTFDIKVDLDFDL